MTMSEWAKREVEIACKKENPNRKDGEWQYGCACYESALKAYLCLIEDGHSGFSWRLTKLILMRLMDGKPLTPIEDIDESWEDGRHYISKPGCTGYQCVRMSSLFKDVYDDGRIIFNDIDRFTCFNIDNPNSSYYSGLVSRIMHEQFPITMPYSGEKWKVYCSDYLTDPKNGDFDTVGIHYAINPNGEKINIGRYFKESSNESGWDEISAEEFLQRKAADEARIEALNASSEEE